MLNYALAIPSKVGSNYKEYVVSVMTITIS